MSGTATRWSACTGDDAGDDVGMSSKCPELRQTTLASCFSQSNPLPPTPKEDNVDMLGQASGGTTGRCPVGAAGAGSGGIRL